jgi:hypothetical protein
LACTSNKDLQQRGKNNKKKKLMKEAITTSYARIKGARTKPRAMKKPINLLEN